MSTNMVLKFDFDKKYNEADLIDVTLRLNLGYTFNTTMETLYNNIKKYAQNMNIEPKGSVLLPFIIKKEFEHLYFLKKNLVYYCNSNISCKNKVREKLKDLLTNNMADMVK